ncbi:Hypothetical predicted protein [Octopus vulgaris]|uniref:Uncharacterized protein n=1 Tax=Octopus vulgaris TaxID=6645 RepID=A0AA36AP19_OCTVU|nr:Hypothetical predicted protein [Octopus vulgaris]
MEFTHRDSEDNQTGCQKPKDHAIEGEDGDLEKVANNIRESSDENEEGDMGTAATNIKKTVDNVEKENSSVDGEGGFSEQLGTIGMELNLLFILTVEFPFGYSRDFSSHDNNT